MMGPEEPQRTGEEREIQQDLRDVDTKVGDSISDNPKGSRAERQRANFIDLHGDEDRDPATSEATYRQQRC